MINFTDTLDSITEGQPMLTIPVGVTKEDTLKCLDLAKAPHILYAGATGSGKSVGLNAAIATLMSRNTPETLRFTMIDPKRVELADYRKSAFVDRVITDMDEANEALEVIVTLMESRYRLLELAGVKNITEYNALGEDQLTYQVLVVDELADLMDTHAATVLPALVRLGQLARAAGIHMMLATQRPAADTTPKKLVSNIPTRIGFMTQSAVESRIILGSKGAEDLKGNGELMAQLPGTKGLVKAQGPFISSDEIKAIVAQNAKTDAAPEIPEIPTDFGNVRTAAADVHEFVSPAAAEGAPIAAPAPAIDQAELVGSIVAQLAEQMENSAQAKIDAAEAAQKDAERKRDELADEVMAMQVKLATLEADFKSAQSQAAVDVFTARQKAFDEAETMHATDQTRINELIDQLEDQKKPLRRMGAWVTIGGAVATLLTLAVVAMGLPFLAAVVPFVVATVAGMKIVNCNEEKKENVNGQHLRPCETESGSRDAGSHSSEGRTDPSRT